MHEGNAGEYRERIRLYPSVPMRCDKHECIVDTTQHKALNALLFGGLGFILLEATFKILLSV